MKKTEPLNPMPDGASRTIKSQYQQSSPANLLKRGGSMAATGVIQYEDNDCSGKRKM